MALRSNSITNAGSNSGMMGTGSVLQHGAARGGMNVYEGQTLKGTVTDVRGNQITIQMNDGTTFTGQLSEASRFSIGQEASFVVTSTNAKTIYLKAITDAAAQDMEDMVFKALEEAALPKSARNVDVVRALLLNQQSVSRESINDALRLCARFPEASVNSVITMNRLPYPLTAENLAQFEQFANNTQQMLPKMDAIADSADQLLEMVGTHADAAAKTIGGQILGLALEDSSFLEGAQATPSQAQPIQTPSTLSDSSELIIRQTAADGTPLPEGKLLIGNNLVSAQIIDGELIFAEGEPLAEALTARFQENPAELSEALAHFAGETSSDYEFVKGEVGTLLTPEQRISFHELLSEFPLPAGMQTSLLSGKLGIHDLLTHLQATLPLSTPEQAGKLISSEEFRSLIHHELMSGWTISPEAMKQKENLGKLYEKLNRQMETLSRFSEQVFSKEAFRELGNSAQGVQQNLEFMKLLNENLSYLQLPLKLKEENAHGDLYVMTRKDSMKKHPEKLRVLLHLELDHIGILDIHLEKDHSMITTKFFVEDKKTQQLFEKNLDLLKDTLNEQGFSFSAETSLQSESFDAIKDFIARDIPIGDMKRYNFDLRA